MSECVCFFVSDLKLYWWEKMTQLPEIAGIALKSVEIVAENTK